MIEMFHESLLESFDRVRKKFLLKFLPSDVTIPQKMQILGILGIKFSFETNACVNWTTYLFEYYRYELYRNKIR